MMRSQSSVPREILNLVWEHYASDDFRTMQANCKPRLFRVGVIDLLNGDIVYDTISKSLSYYSGGSIVKKKIYLYSLDGFNQFEIDKRASKYKRVVSEHFNFYIHGISPKDGTYQTFNDVDIREIVEYAIQNLLYVKRRFIVCEKDSPEKREQAYQAVCKNIREVFYHYNKSGDLIITCTGFKDFVEKLAYNSLRLSLK